MKLEKINNINVISADDDNFLYNGSFYCKKAFLGKSDIIDNWREVDKDEVICNENLHLYYIDGGEEE